MSNSSNCTGSNCPSPATCDGDCWLEDAVTWDDLPQAEGSLANGERYLTDANLTAEIIEVAAKQLRGAAAQETFVAKLGEFGHLPLVRREGDTFIVSNSCERCGGSGYIQAFAHNAGGECFSCFGSNTKNATVSYSLKGYAQAIAKPIRKRIKDILDLRAKRDAATAYRAANAEVAAWLDANMGRSSFAASLDTALTKNGGLTEKQEQAVRTAIAREQQQAEEKANAAPVATGNGVEVTGTLVSTKVRNTAYGAKRSIIVKAANGSRVWTNCPTSIEDQIADADLTWDDAIGCEVSFTANVEAADDDKSFGFAKRPRKATITLPTSEPAEGITVVSADGVAPARVAALLRTEPGQPVEAAKLAAAITAMVVEDSSRAGNVSTASILAADEDYVLARARSTNLKEDHEALRTTLQDLGTATVRLPLA